MSTDQANHVSSERPTAARVEMTGLPHGVMTGVGALVIVSLIAEYGFLLSPGAAAWLDRLDLLLAACFGLDLLLSLYRSRARTEHLRQRWLEWALLVFFVASLELIAWFRPTEPVQELLAFLHIGSVAKLCFVWVRFYLLINSAIRFLRAHEKLLGKGIQPVGLLVGSFALLILIGTVLLALPKASAVPGSPIHPLDAFFTATSAVCVTGLTVVDTGSGFSPIGKVIIMTLFQIGGLGIMTFVAWVTVLSGKAFSVPQMVAMREVVNARAFSDVKRQVTAVVVATVLIEALGAAILYFAWPGTPADPLEKGFWCAFHAISAFCNAGFGLAPDSLESVRGNCGVILTMALLIVIGGIGFPVLRDLFAFRVSALRFLRRWRLFREWRYGTIPSRLRAQTRLSLAMTGALVVFAAFSFWSLEFAHLLNDKPVGEQALATLLQSVTARTAGFSSVPFDQLQDATLLLMAFLMVIGASPVSTGGGIKTVTFAVLLLTIRSFLLGRDRVEVFGRTIPRRVVHAAVSVFVMYVLMAALVTFGLVLSNPDIEFRKLAFEALSALSTVGLSTGITPSLNAVGKAILCLAMFAGRVGPLSLVMTVIHSRGHGSRYRFPDEELVVG